MTQIKFPFQNVISLTVMLKSFKVIFFDRNAHLLACVSEQDKLSALEKIKMKSSKAMFET